jgi:hypothetical protein
MMVPGITLRGPRKRKPKVKPVAAPEMVEARMRSEWEGPWSGRDRRGAPRVRFHQFRTPADSRIEVRMLKKVVPMANHWTPETREKRMGV